METIIATIGIMLTVAGLWVMAQQKRVADLQARLAMHEMRHGIYDATLRVVFELMTYGKLRNEEIGWRFLHSRRLAKLCYGADVQSVMEQVYDLIGEVAIEAATETEGDARARLHRLYQDAPGVFGPYLEVK